MNRLQKKCFIASTGFHLLLALILIVGPAFLSSNPKTDDLPLLNFVPVKTVDSLMSGGGNPKAQPPPAVAQPAPQPPAAAPPMPQPQPEPQKANEPVPDKAEPVKERKHAIEVSTTPIKRQRDESFEVGRAAEKRAREAGETRQRAAAAIGRAVRGIESGLSGSTTIELQGPGGGGVPYANWKQAVKTAYDRAWVLPAGVAADSATTTVTVTIARDGTVISSSITRFSGNADVDQSVQATLDRVRYAAPLPDDAKEDQRTITIYFDVKAKLLG